MAVRITIRKRSVALPSISLRSYLSHRHLRAAALFARNAGRLEKEWRDKESGHVHAEHSAFVVSSILRSLAFMEATINELFTDTAESRDLHFKELDSDTVQALGNAWNHANVDKLSVLDKFALALALARKPPMKDDGQVWQSGELLKRLRNELVHAKPRSSQAGTEELGLSKFEKQLMNEGFSPNPLTSEGNPYYPDKCLGHGCALWSVKTALGWTDDFFKRLGIPWPFEHQREEITEIISEAEQPS